MLVEGMKPAIPPIIIDNLTSSSHQADTLNTMLAQSGCDVLIRGPKGETMLTALLQAAAPELLPQQPQEERVAFLIKVGVSVGLLLAAAPALIATPDGQGRLPLHWAVATAEIRFVRMLVRWARRLEAKAGATKEEVAMADRALSGVDDAGMEKGRMCCPGLIP